MWVLILCFVFNPLLESQFEIPIIEKDGLIYIDAKIQGEKKTFLIDSGSSNTILHGKVERHDDMLVSLYGEIPIRDKKVRGLEIGGFEPIGINAAEADLSVLDVLNSKIDGILGMDYLKDKILLFDFSSESMSFLDKEAKANLLSDNRVFQFPLLTSGSSIPMLELESNGDKFKFLLDTGSNVHAVREDLLNKIGPYLRLKNKQKAVRIMTKNTSDQQCIFTIRERNSGTSPDYDGILSITQLGFKQVLIDFKKGELILFNR